MIHAYLICEPQTAASLPQRRGLRGAQLRAARADGLAAVYSRHRSAGASPDLVLAHEGVIEAVMKKGTVLPLRFGTRLEHERELIAAIATRQDELRAALERVRGHVEMGLRVIPRGERRPGQERASGRAYLLERVAGHRLAERAKQEIHMPLTRLATAHVVPPRISPPAVFVAAYLVRAEEVDRFRSRAQARAAELPEARSFTTGPWPAYNFVELPGRFSEFEAKGRT